MAEDGSFWFRARLAIHYPKSLLAQKTDEELEQFYKTFRAQNREAVRYSYAFLGLAVFSLVTAIVYHYKTLEYAWLGLMISSGPAAMYRASELTNINHIRLGRISKKLDAMCRRLGLEDLSDKLTMEQSGLSEQAKEQWK